MKVSQFFLFTLLIPAVLFSDSRMTREIVIDTDLTLNRSLCNPVFITQVDMASGFTISASGVYKVAENLSYSGLGTAITIEASNVILDLQCFELSTVSGMRGILIDSARSHVEIINGVISGFAESGVRGVEDCRNISIKGVTVENCGTGIDFDGMSGEIKTFDIDGCAIRENAKGIMLSNANKGFIRNCLLQTHTKIAIDLQQSFSNKICKCEIMDIVSDADAVGINLEDGGCNIIKECCIRGLSSISTDSGNVAAGILIGQNEFEDKIECNQVCKVVTTSNAQPFGIKMTSTIAVSLTELDAGAIDNGMGSTIQVAAVKWSPNARYVAVSSVGGITAFDNLFVFEFDGNNITLVATATVIDSGQSTQVSAVSWSPDGRYLAVSSHSVSQGFENVRLYEFTGTSLNQLAGFVYESSSMTNLNLQSIDWSKDGTFIIIGGENAALTDNVRVLKFDGVDTLTEVAGFTYSTSLSVASVAWSPNKRFAAIAGAAGGGGFDNLRVLGFDGTTLTDLAGFELLDGLAGINILEIAWSNDGNFILLGANAGSLSSFENVRVLKFDGSTLQEVAGYAFADGDSSEQVQAVAWSPDDRFALIGGRRNSGATDNLQVLAFDKSSLNLVSGFFFPGNPSFVSALDMTPHGCNVAFGGLGNVNNFRILEGLQFPNDHKIVQNFVCDVNGPASLNLEPNAPGVSTGRGIEASSCENLIIGNTAYNNDINYTFMALERFKEFLVNIKLRNEFPNRLSNTEFPPL